MNKGVLIAAILAIIVLGMMYVYGLDNNLMSYDEGSTYLYPSLMARMGHDLYSELPSNLPPILLLLAPFSVIAGRVMTLMMLAIACLLLYKAGKRFGVGVFAVLFLLSCPIVMEFGKVYMGDIPIIMFMTLFILLVITKAKTYRGGIVYGIATGIVMFLAIMTKLQLGVPFIILLGVLLLLDRHCIHSDRYMASVVVFILLVGLFVTQPMFKELFVDNFNSVITVKEWIVMVRDSVAIFVSKASFMLAFTFLGLCECIRRRDERKVQVLLIVLGTAIITVLSYSFFNYRYFIYLLPVLSIMAGMGLKSLKNSWLAIAVVCLAVFIPLAEFHESTLYDSDTRAISSMVANMTKQGDYIYTDEPMIAYLSERQMPPMAHMWNWLGKYRGLNEDVVINEIREYKPKVVALVTSVPYQKMTRPRVESVFGIDGGKKIIDYLDCNYQGKTYHSRNYQYMTIWYDPDFLGENLGNKSK